MIPVETCLERESDSSWRRRNRLVINSPSLGCHPTPGHPLPTDGNPGGHAYQRTSGNLRAFGRVSSEPNLHGVHPMLARHAVACSAVLAVAALITWCSNTTNTSAPNHGYSPGADYGVTSGSGTSSTSITIGTAPSAELKRSVRAAYTIRTGSFLASFDRVIGRSVALGGISQARRLNRLTTDASSAGRLPSPSRPRASRPSSLGCRQR